MKRILSYIGTIIVGFIIGFLVQEYTIQRQRQITTNEKEQLKQKIETVNEILIKRLEEDYQAFKDSVDQVFVMKRKEMIEKQGEPPAGSELAIKMRFEAEKSRILTKKRGEIDRQIEDLKMKLDF